MEKNLGTMERIIRILLAGILGFAAAFLFIHPIARIAAACGALFAIGEALLGRCYLYAHLGSRNLGEPLQDQPRYLIGLMAIQMVIAYEWWSAGWEKISSPFVDTLAQGLGYFASQNPFGWYRNFLLGFATENATLFGYAVEWSQVGIALVLFFGGILLVYARNQTLQRIAVTMSLLALLGGLLMNANFYFAAAWTGPGTRGINVVMFWVQGILFYVLLSRLAKRTNEIS